MQERERKKESLTRSLSRNKFNMLEQLPALLYLLRVKHIFCFEWFHLFYVCFYQDKHCVVAFLMEGIWRFCSCSSLISHTDDDSHLCLDDLKFYPKFKAYLWILLICLHWAGKYPKKKAFFCFCGNRFKCCTLGKLGAMSRSNLPIFHTESILNQYLGDAFHICL